ncbi:MAG TPA: primosomal protein N' [Anaeromyxobacteraceae bacterium]|nr:primosomal protein N' [Anaeromyxobacteraceae bacterium]
MLVEVAVAAAVRGTFTYRVPHRLGEEVALGSRVAVPFGKSPRATGYVVGFPTAPPPGVELRDLADVLDEFPPFTEPLLRLVRWAEDYYLTPPGELLRAALPPGLNTRGGASAPARRGVEYAAPSPAAAAGLGLLDGRARAQRAVLEYLLARGRIPVEELRAAFPRGRAALASLAKRGLAVVETVSIAAGGGSLLPAAEAPLALSPAQSEALARLTAADGDFHTFLLHGVTGSGKTEVYLQAIARARAAGRGALVLVPEIALTPQLAGRFRSRFGDQVALLHSGLSDPERHSEWLRLRRGEAGICVGVRSAVFAPVPDLGILVVDEEHDPSFKQEDGPAYHARDLAVVRARMEKAVCVLGSATPSLETLENARSGKYQRLALPERIDSRPMPEVQLVDLSRLRRHAPSPGLLSPVLEEALRETVAAGRQAILFLNRRGFQTLVICRDCGREERCQHCAVSLTYHARRGQLLCHYCGATQRMTPMCPTCHGERAGIGVGTEQVEAAVRALLPGARVARLDRDAVKGAVDLAEVLARFARREVDVLVGTQMVTKGHDFPGVTLVGVVLADTALALPDFRAAERTFQLLTQVAGRAGRGGEAGRVVVQTFHPHSPAIAFSVGHDYLGFAEVERENRRALGYPPFGRMLAVRVEGSEAGARRTAEALGEAARPALEPGVTLLGPAPAAIERIRGRSRWHLLFKAADAPALRRLHRALAPLAARPPGGAQVRFDVDPHSML